MKRVILTVLVFLTPLLCAGSFAQSYGGKAAQKRFIKTEPQSVTLKTEDGWTLSGTFRPPQPDMPVLLFMHAYKEDSEGWQKLARSAADLGYGYFLLDFRGHGKSLSGPAGSATYETFDKGGADNEYNRMTADADAALVYISSTAMVPETGIILVGAGLGANIAIKTAAAHKEISMMALFSPTLNANHDVLTVNPLKEYGSRPVFMAASVENQRLYREVAILRGILYLNSGSRYVTFVTVKKGFNTEILKPNVTQAFINWLKWPYMPEPVEVPGLSVSDEAAPVAAQTPQDPAETTER
ncbi:MAG: alpha/beta fold hydrolase [Elusimicrobiaceae bacterium]|jgi:pimeloyl-ACP methyl ester carboxylesterase